MRLRGMAATYAFDLMRHPWLLAPILLLVGTPASAQVAAEQGWPLTSRAIAFQETPGDSPSLSLGFMRLPPPFSLDPRPAPGLTKYRSWLPGERTAEWGAAMRSRHRPALELSTEELRAPREKVEFLPPDPRQRSGTDLLPDILSDHADLGVNVRARGELGGSWSRYEPCDPGLMMMDCNPGRIPQLRPDVQVSVRVGGTISERVHVNVDYDQQREFDAANNIRIHYSGLQDEILQNIEVGDVAFRFPRSRYVTHGIPAGNFGFRTGGQMGPIDFQMVWAQQKGDVTAREFRLDGSRDRQGMIRDAAISLDDADYVRGQFFILVDADSITDAPHVDILRLRSGDAPATLRPRSGSRIELYRDERRTFRNPEDQTELGYFQAEAKTPDGGFTHTGRFRRLIPGEDYMLHSSGLWVTLRSPLRGEEALALAYITETGDTIGTLNADQVQEGVPKLRLLRAPESVHQPGFPTWKHELKQVYRVDSSDRVEAHTVEMSVSLGEASGGSSYRDYAGQQVTLLKLFGLDEESPVDQLDRARVFQPANLGAGHIDRSARVGGTFVVLPTFQPFAEPPPVPSLGLSAEETSQLLEPDANVEIYENPDPLMRRSSGRFRIEFQYRVEEQSGTTGVINLGALGIREGSEQIVVDGQPLERGVDYQIDYDIGELVLLNPQAFFATRTDPQVRATWEQHAMYQIAPTSLFGLNAQYGLGQRGELNFMGIYQAERTLMTRPHLGAEPGSIFLGGVSGRYDGSANWLDRALQSLPGARPGERASVNLSGEVAMSLPNPNTRGETYVDDFEATDQMHIGMDKRVWRLGSRPDNLDGAAGVLPDALDVENAARIVWQHNYRDASGHVFGPLHPHQIDTHINVAGMDVREPTLYITLGQQGDEPGVRRWRSLTSVLSTTGRDMSRSEYIEFYAHGDQDVTLIFDVGEVSNDAFYFNEAGETSGVREDGTEWGLGVLDQEADLAGGEIWGTEHDARGLWDQTCEGSPSEIFPLGDERANCTRLNGMFDTEDLDGSGVLRVSDGPLFRYVVRLGDDSPYLVRGRGDDGTGTPFRLYRIPLRGPDAMPLNGAGTATWRYIKHLRMTVASPAGGSQLLILSRARIVGSRWTKRSNDGVLAGATGIEPGTPGAQIQVGPVSRITDGAAYSSPPGVFDELMDPTRGFGGASVEYNEKGLRLTYEDLAPDERAEIFFRYLQQPRNLLDYRRLRLWALPRHGNWGEDGDQYLFVKLGTNAGNYYFYRTPLRPSVDEGNVTTEDWLPEILVDFDPWFDLKVRAEQAYITGDAGDGPLVLWSDDDRYGIVMQDRFVAPNLNSVREISIAVHNASGQPADGEVWINDIRLDEAMRDAGFAGHMDLGIRGGGLVSASLSYRGGGALFRQMGQDMSHQHSEDYSVGASAQVGRMLPDALGIDLPVTINYSRSSAEPMFLDRTDIRADRFEGLRPTDSERRSIGMSVRRRGTSTNPLIALFLDPTTLRLGVSDARTGSVTASSEARSTNAGLSYGRRVTPREVGVVPGFVRDALYSALPDRVTGSSFFEGIMGARFRWSPESFSFSNNYSRRRAETRRYSRILVSDDDAAIEPIESWNEALDNSARLSLRPFQTMSANFSVNSRRDMIPPDRATTRAHERHALQDARTRLGGLDIGWERSRSVTSQMNYRPRPTSWLTSHLSYTAQFRTDRNPSHLELFVEDGDTSALMQRNFTNDRQLNTGFNISPADLMPRMLSGAVGSGSLMGRLIDLVDAFQPLDLRWSNRVNSRYERELLDPSLGYQLGLGSLDNLRFMEGDTAVVAGTSTSFTAHSGVRLPLRAQLSATYTRSDSDRFDMHGGHTNSVETTWPDLSLRFTGIPIPEFMQATITRASASTGFQFSRSTSVFGGFDGQPSTGESVMIPFRVQLGLPHGMSVSYDGTFRLSEADEPTGSNRRETLNQSARLSGRYRPPADVSDVFTNPIQISIVLSQQENHYCRVRQQAAGDDCIPTDDSRMRRMELTLNTLVDRINVGLRASYNERESYVGTRSGSSQFQMGLFGNYTFSAGSFSAGAVRR